MKIPVLSKTPQPPKAWGAFLNPRCSFFKAPSMGGFFSTPAVHFLRPPKHGGLFLNPRCSFFKAPEAWGALVCRRRSENKLQ